MERLLLLLTAEGSDGSELWIFLIVLLVLVPIAYFCGRTAGQNASGGSSGPCDYCGKARRVVGVFWLNREESNRRLAKFCPMCGRPLPDNVPDQDAPLSDEKPSGR